AEGMAGAVEEDGMICARGGGCGLGGFGCGSRGLLGGRLSSPALRMSDTRCLSEANRKSCPGRRRRIGTAWSLRTTIPLTCPWRKRRSMTTAGSSWRVYSLGTSTKCRCEADTKGFFGPQRPVLHLQFWGVVAVEAVVWSYVYL